MATDEWGTTTTSDDDFVFDGSGRSEADLGSNFVTKEGWYHFEVADVVRELDRVSERGQPKSPAMRFDLVVLHEVAGQSPSGARHYHRIYVGDKDGGPPKEGSLKSALRFGVGLGILREVEIEGQPAIVDAQTGSPQIRVSTWERAKGMQVIARIEKRQEQEGSKYGPSYEIPFARVYQPDDSQVADVPKNLEALALIGKAPTPKNGAAKEPAKTPAKPQAKPPQQAAPVASGGGMSDEDLADL